MSDQFWKKCSTCKRPIRLNQKYYVCNVSTCNRDRTGLVFCSVPCFDGHLPIMRHKNAYALEKISPSIASMSPSSTTPSSTPARASIPTSPQDEILVVVSKVKDYIREKWGCNTAQSAIEVLSDKVKDIADEAMDRAEKDKRQTVMDRDIP